VFHGWRDTGRNADTYSVSYSTVEAPATFIPLYNSASHVNDTSAGSNYGRNSVLIEESDGVTGVKAVRIEWVTYYLHGVSEIDMFGTPTPTAPTGTILILR